MRCDVPVLTTERLILRAPEAADFEDLRAYYADPRSAWNGGPLDAAGAWRVLASHVGQWILRGHGLWYAICRESGDWVGFAGLFHPHDWPEPELGWGIARAFEGRGLAHEMARAARAAAAAQLHLDRLPSFIVPDNTRSRRLAERLDAREETRMVLRDTPLIVYRHPGAGHEAA